MLDHTRCETLLPYNVEGVKTFLEVCDSFNSCGKTYGPVVNTAFSDNTDGKLFLQIFKEKLNSEDFYKTFGNSWNTFAKIKLNTEDLPDGNLYIVKTAYRNFFNRTGVSYEVAIVDLSDGNRFLENIRSTVLLPVVNETEMTDKVPQSKRALTSIKKARIKCETGNASRVYRKLIWSWAICGRNIISINSAINLFGRIISIVENQVRVKAQTKNQVLVVSICLYGLPLQYTVARMMYWKQDTVNNTVFSQDKGRYHLRFLIWLKSGENSGPYQKVRYKIRIKISDFVPCPSINCKVISLSIYKENKLTFQ
ncbi:hypothetical protein NQ315_007515 [Exocentrus adspersus]|uniref:Uncharacterized protein n=1 Tax=Exocentrus adspersus TaxID=1586481 RepID=A0AAV8W786_9CUCU|nr:hypothetical protein NQ315_007515 [Exocentrus adspersus]